MEGNHDGITTEAHHAPGINIMCRHHALDCVKVQQSLLFEQFDRNTNPNASYHMLTNPSVVKVLTRGMSVPVGEGADAGSCK